MQKKPKLDLVETIDDIKDNIRTLNEQAKNDLETLRPIIKQHFFKSNIERYWVYDSDTSQFGIGKFVGYRNMTFELRKCLLYYEKKCQSNKFNGVEFSGEAAHDKIADVVSEELGVPKKFCHNENLITKLKKWAKDHLGINLEKKNTAKWKFLEL